MPGSAPLARDVIQIWFTSPPEGDPSAPMDLLSEDERARAARFVFEKDRRLFVTGKWMVRTLLGRALDRPPAVVVFTRSSDGKPALGGGEAASGLTFNLAHSGRQLVCGLGLGRRIGVDVEERHPLETLALARRYFGPQETRRLEAATGAERERLFFKYWTLKEAYLKAEGSGLGLSLRALDVSCVPDEPGAGPRAPIEDEPRGLLVQTIEAPEGYAAALASDGPAWTCLTAIWRPPDF